MNMTKIPEGLDPRERIDMIKEREKISSKEYIELKISLQVF